MDLQAGSEHLGWCCLRLIQSEQWIFCWKKPTVTVTGVSKKGKSSANHKTNAKPIWLQSVFDNEACCQRPLDDIAAILLIQLKNVSRNSLTGTTTPSRPVEQVGHPNIQLFPNSEHLKILKISRHVNIKYPKMWKNVARRLKISNHPNNHPLPTLFPLLKKGSESCGIPIPTSQWLDQLQDIMNSHLTWQPWILSWMWSFDD